MGDNLFTLMIAAAVNIFIIILLFVAAKALKKDADRLFNRQEQVRKLCDQAAFSPYSLPLLIADSA